MYYAKIAGGDRRDIRPFACSNRRVLSQRTGMGYSNVVRVFTRERRYYYETEEYVVLRFFEGDIVRGKQKLSIQGRSVKRFTGSHLVK